MLLSNSIYDHFNIGFSKDLLLYVFEAIATFAWYVVELGCGAWPRVSGALTAFKTHYFCSACKK